MTVASSVSNSIGPSRERPKYVRAVGPKLRILLYAVFALVAVLGANSVYLVSITGLEWFTGLTYQNFFYQCMFLLHLALGLLLIGPFIVFEKKPCDIKPGQINSIVNAIVIWVAKGAIMPRFEIAIKHQI